MNWQCLDLCKLYQQGNVSPHVFVFFSGIRAPPQLPYASQQDIG